jgi:hypothetical protein
MGTERDSPNCYQNFITILLPMSTARLFSVWQDIPASKIGESIGSYQEYPAKSVGRQGEEFLIVTLVKSSLSGALYNW